MLEKPTVKLLKPGTYYMDKINMSMKEREQMIIFNKLDAKEISKVAAAKILNMTTRWLRTKYKRFREKGVEALVHQGRDKPSTRRWNSDDRALFVELLASDWKDFGPTFAAEKFKERYPEKKVSRETVRKVMIEEGFWSKKRNRPKHRKRRERKEYFGELVQLDGSPHDWFEGRAPTCTLLVFIDDATSTLLWLEFALSESFHAVAQATRHYLEQHGRPKAFYVDCGGVFRVNLNNADREKLTQFERAMNEINASVIHAYSPQAKGRVERVNRTLQDRLIKEMRLANISSMEEANNFLRQSQFITKHNARFAVPAAKTGNIHRSISEYDLSNILCIKATRRVANDYTLSYKRRILQLSNHQPTIIRPKNDIIVYEHLDQTLSLHIRNCTLNFKEIAMRPQKLSPVDHVKLQSKEENTTKQNNPNTPKIPAWRREELNITIITHQKN